MTNPTLLTTAVEPAAGETDRPVVGCRTHGSTLRRLIGCAAAATALAAGIGSTTASADACHGDIVGQNTASQWPFAHGDEQDFAPPKGGFALWVDTFGFENNPGDENQVIRDLCRQ
jgi:hypothetical protein